MTTAELRKSEFQTPPELCRYMASLVPDRAKTILEPTPGDGNLVRELSNKFNVTAPEDFFQMERSVFDCVVTNPPFSIEYAYGMPDEINKKGSQVGYHILKSCMEMSDTIIALLPWFIITNSEKRMKEIKAWGLKSVCVVPRRWFKGSRVSNCILFLQKGYTGKIEMTMFEA
jgi:type I restriction-modification system DNA methylase subunit